MNDIGLMMGVLTGVGIFFGIILIYTVITTLQICDPSEIMVISGRSSQCQGKTVGYSPQQGWAVKWPVIEKVYKLDLRNMTIALTVHDAFSKEGVPLTVEGVANIKVFSRQPMLNNAVERFMGMPREHIMRIARETLEGNLRGVLATMTPEQVNHDKMLFAQSLLEEADKDLQRLGLELDNLKIQNIRDEEGYLDCLGRTKQASQKQENRTAEETNRRMAGVREAENRQIQTLAELDSRLQVIRADASTRIADAQTRREAVVAQERARVAQEIARADAELGVYKALIEQVHFQLQADVLQPAEAAREKALAEARATVAPVRESGRATAKMLTELVGAWSAAGPDAREVFRMQKLDGFLDTLLGTLPEVNLDRLTVIGAGSGGGTDSLSTRALALTEEVKGTLGVDLTQLVSGASQAARALAPSGSRSSLPPPAPKYPPGGGGRGGGGGGGGL
jgi:flotillin